ncbi:MAG: hypothetical protein ACNA77_10515 [Opitutales bacterium]
MSKRKTRKSKHFRILGYRVRRTRFFVAFLATLFLPAIFFLVLFALLKADRNEVARIVVGPVSVGVEEHESESELAALLRRHRHVTGLYNCSSMTMHGTYREENKLYETALSIRLPGMIRKKMWGRGFELVMVSVGKSGQVRSITSSGEHEVQSIGEGDLYWYTLLLEGGGLRLAEGGESHYTYELLPPEKEEEYRRIISSTDHGVTFTHLIDRESGFEIERRIEFIADNKEYKLRLLLEDRRPAGDSLLPHLYRLQINGVERAELRVDSVQLNPVIPEWFFALESARSGG